MGSNTLGVASVREEDDARSPSNGEFSFEGGDCKTSCIHAKVIHARRMGGSKSQNRAVIITLQFTRTHKYGDIRI